MTALCVPTDNVVTFVDSQPPVGQHRNVNAFANVPVVQVVVPVVATGVPQSVARLIPMATAAENQSVLRV